MASRPNATISSDHCIQFMINYLNRTPTSPDIQNPLPDGRSLSAFSN